MLDPRDIARFTIRANARGNNISKVPGSLRAGPPSHDLASMPREPNGQTMQAHHNLARDNHTKVPRQGRIGARALVEPELS
eukprot:15461953-Alexandrium_andersonii.AAC.1